MAQLAITDFKGELELVATNSPSFDEVCEDTEQEVMRRLLGDNLYKSFSKITEPYKTLWDGGYYYVKNSAGNYAYKYQTGLKKTLMYFVYNDFIRAQTSKASKKGAVTFEEANNHVLLGEDLNAFLQRKYNQGVLFTKELEHFINEMNQSVEITAINGLVLSTPITRLLAIGDTIEVGGTEVTVTAVEANVSITVSEVVSGNYWLKEYFEDWVLNKFRPMFGGTFF